MANYTQTNTYVQSVDNQRGHPPAQTVGNEFSRQFYLVLTQQPALAHRFYTDGSSLTNAVAGALGVTVYGQTAINEKIMSMNLEGAHVEVESVDAQYSLAGGVTVLITGQLTKVGKERRPFVQSFFLATQERGYFVLNDTFRYMEPQKEAYPADRAPGSVTSVNPYTNEGNGYSSHEGPSSIGHHSQAPQEPHAQASSFQHANGHLHAPPANPDLGSGFSSGHSSGDLAQIPSPPPSQGLPPPPPRPETSSLAPSPTPPQQPPSAPSHDSPTEQEPEQIPNQEPQPEQQQEQASQEQGASNDQPVPQPAVDQNRPPVKPQRRPSAPAPQEAQRKGSGQQSGGAPAPARTTPMTYAALLKAANPASGPSQPSGRPHTPSQPGAGASTATSAQPTSPTSSNPLPPRASGNRNQGRHPPTAPHPGADTSGKGDQRGGAAYGASPDNKPAGNTASANGPPARPPYSAPGRGPAQGYRDDESSKKAVFVRNVPQDATSQDIRELFSQFGTIKPQNGAITVKHNGNNNSFAYVDFVDVASAQACVEAKDVQLNGVTLDITPKRASFGGGRGGGRYGGRGDGRGPGGYRGRGGDRGGFGGRGGPPPPAASFSEDAQNGIDRPQGNRQNSGGPGPVRGRGGRDGVRGRGRGGARTPTTSQPTEVAPSVAE
ncbi:hypothetical protein ABBQ38_010004 [Trebouxia sp. C0009 RCD-2024]